MMVNYYWTVCPFSGRFWNLFIHHEIKIFKNKYKYYNILIRKRQFKWPMYHLSSPRNYQKKKKKGTPRPKLILYDNFVSEFLVQVYIYKKLFIYLSKI